MSILLRNDGTHFIVQAYRERLAITKRSTGVQKVRLFSEQHGQYVLLTLAGADSLEAIFSKEAGYLLGETIWHYFDRPKNLIYCERLSNEHNRVLLVVIRDGSIYLDNQVENDKLRSELLPFMTVQDSFRIVTCGEVLLAQTESPGHFVLPKNLVESFENLTVSVYAQLPVLQSCRLLSLPLALKSPLLGTKIPTIAIASIIAVLVVGAWWLVASKPIPKVAAEKPAAHNADNSYTDFYNAMHTPSPLKQLSELIQTVEQFYGLPGWQADGINYNGGQYHVQLIRQGGTVQWIMQWADRHHYSMNLDSEKVELILPSQLTTRLKPRSLYSLPQVVASLIDELDRLLKDQVITVGDVKEFGKTKTRNITINLKDISPDVLALVGDTLGNNLPLSITAINVNVNNGMLKGTIQLSVWGI